MDSFRKCLSEYGPKAWSSLKPHLEQAVGLTVAEFADKVAQSARDRAAR